MLDRVVLGGAAVAGTVAAIALIVSEIRAGWIVKAGVWAYAACLVAMVACAVHFASRPALKDWLRRWDHAAIFLFAVHRPLWHRRLLDRTSRPRLAGRDRRRGRETHIAAAVTAAAFQYAAIFITLQHLPGM